MGCLSKTDHNNVKQLPGAILVNSPTPKDTLFYDGECPICNAEITKLEAQIDDNLVCVDIHSATITPVDKPALFSQLHLLRADGELLVGLEANVAAWQHTKWAGVANILLWPVIRWFAELGYKAWLFWYQRQRAKRLAEQDSQRK
jgi:predicted DCC family thiol-disulfide oxidoreductase YuxK